MENSGVLNMLNNILEYLNDSYQGYKQASESVDNHKLAALFTSLSNKRQRMAAELLEKIKVRNLTPQKEGSITGAAHRIFVSLKGVLTGGNVDAIITEVKRGENTSIETYKEALRDKFLPDDIRAVLNSQLSEFEKDIAEIDKSSI